MYWLIVSGGRWTHAGDWWAGATRFHVSAACARNSVLLISCSGFTGCSGASSVTGAVTVPASVTCR